MKAPHYADDSVTLYHGDCLDVLREMPDASVDSVVCDPPYGLSATSTRDVVNALTRWTGGERDYVPEGAGFMGKSWDAFVPPPAVWDECMRVLKPGGHLLAFAGSRTHDLMGLSIRLAGFEIRDSIMWIYGTGFAKSLDVSKAIDKQRDDRPDILRVTGWLAAQRDRAGLTNRDIDEAFNFHGMAGHWTAAPHLKIAHVPQWEQWQKLRELIGFGDEMDAEVWRLNGRKGTPGEAWGQREVIGARTTGIGTGNGSVPYIGDSGNRDITAAATDAARQWEGWGTALKPSHEPVVVARKPLAGTVAQNVTQYGTGALNTDGCRIEGRERTDYGLANAKRSRVATYGNPSESADFDASQGRWPTNVVLDEAMAAELDRQSGWSKSPPVGSVVKVKASQGFDGKAFAIGAHVTSNGKGDEGGASRFFPVFKYTAKAGSDERPEVDGVRHPTVKPVSLISWLVKLVTPPGGLVLDPFAGSGTTGEAAVLEHMRAILIEREPDYLPLIVSRLSKPLQVGFDFREAA